MRIAAIAGSVPTARNPSTGIFYMRMLEEFVQAGHDVALIAPSKIGMSRSAVGLPAGVRTVRTSYWPTGRLQLGLFDGRAFSLRSYCAAVARGFAHLGSRPDALFAHFFVPAGVAADELSRRSGIPAFCSLGESQCGQWFSRLESAEVKERLARFRCLFPVSEHMAEYLRGTCQVDSANLLTVPNAVDQTLFRPRSKAQARHALDVPQEKKIALFVGSSDPRKGAQYVVAAAGLLPADWNVWIVGPGHGKTRATNVRIIGPLAHQRLPAYYQAADVLVLPSKAEGMPNSLLEAIACGTPVVVSRIPVTVELLGEHYPLYCELDAAHVALKIQAAQHQVRAVGLTKPVITVAKRAAIILDRMASAMQSGVIHS